MENKPSSAPLNHVVGCEPPMNLAGVEEKLSKLTEQLSRQQEGYVGRGPDGIRMALVVEEDCSASLEVIRLVGEGTDQHVECWVLSPDEALRLLLLGASADRQASNRELDGAPPIPTFEILPDRTNPNVPLR